MKKTILMITALMTFSLNAFSSAGVQHIAQGPLAVEMLKNLTTIGATSNSSALWTAEVWVTRIECKASTDGESKVAVCNMYDELGNKALEARGQPALLLGRELLKAGIGPLESPNGPIMEAASIHCYRKAGFATQGTQVACIILEAGK